MIHLRRWLAALMLCGACSDQSNDATPEVQEATLPAIETQAASQPSAPQSPPGRQQCSPPKATSEPDINSITIGMDASTAVDYLYCIYPNGTVHHFGYRMSGLTEIEDGQPRFLEWAIKTDSEFMTIRVIGIRGSEIVVGVSRRIRFTAGSEPLAESVVSQITSKFGLRNQPPFSGPIFAGYSNDGNQPSASGWQFGPCVSGSLGGGGLEVPLTPNCGRVNGALVMPAGDNADLVGEVAVFMVDNQLAREKRDEFNAYAERENASISAMRRAQAADRKAPAL